MERGVCYLLIGTRHLVVAAVSVYTLRKVYPTLPIMIFSGDEASWNISVAIGDAAKAAMVQPMRTDWVKRNVAYTVKPAIPKLSPFENTIQLDGDTVVVREFEELWPRHPKECVITSYSTWNTAGRLMQSRITKWAAVAPDETERALAKAHPSINTGVVAYGPESKLAHEEWLEMSNRRAGKFISDEIAMQLLMVDHPEVRIVDDRYNCSPRYGHNTDDARILHMHGKKSVHPAFIEKWWPHFEECWNMDFAGIQSWCPAGFGRLRDYLLEHRPDMICDSQQQD